MSNDNAPKDLSQQMSALKTDDDIPPQQTGLIPNDDKAEIIIEKSHAMDAIYTSATTFEELNLPEELLKGVRALKFERPSQIQAKALPIILANPPVNLIAQAQAGTGKTAAFTLSSLKRTDPNLRSPQVVIVAPTRELARQTHEFVKQVAQFTTIQVLLAVPDADLPKGKVPHQIVIGTPGKLDDLLRRRAIPPNDVKVLIFDEADQMLDKQGFLDQSKSIRRSVPPQTQTLLFSATYTPGVLQFARQIVSEPCTILRLKAEEVAIDKILQYSVDCGGAANKFKLLSDLYGFLNVGQCIIFVNERATAQDLYKRMTTTGFVVSMLHGTDKNEMTTEMRDKVIDDFRSGKTRVLITTNLLARGIDVLTVSLVINYDLPYRRDSSRPDVETYLHRIGRTARFGRFGVAISLVHDDKTKQDLNVIAAELCRPIKDFPTADFERLPSILRELN